MNLRPLAITATSVVLLSALVAPARAAALETWVSGVGDDANPCSRTDPCKTFAGAISKTEEGGIIRVLDPGGYGSVNITKSITIDATGPLGSVLGSNVNSVVVNAGPTDRVVLRGLDLTGGQNFNTSCGPNQVSGVRVVSAGLVQIENTWINLTSVSGVEVAPSVNPAKVVITGSQIRNGCGPGVRVNPTAGVAASVEVIDSTISLNTVGLDARNSGTIRAHGTRLLGNGAATAATTGGSVDVSDLSNRIAGNAALEKPQNLNSFATATRTWVSGTGDDANPCSRTAPCKTVAGASSKTSSGGQINVLDGAQLGALSITKPLTIDGSGTTAGIRLAAGSGITINVSAVESVVLRNLTITGITDGAAVGCPFPATSGVRILNARSVHLENSTVSGFATAGVDVAPTSTNPRVVIDHSVISNVCGTAVRVAPAAGQTATAFVSASSIVSSGTALSTTAAATIVTMGSYLANNTTASAGAGTFTTFPDTIVQEVIKEVPVNVPVEVPVEVPVQVPVTPVAQTPVSCKAMPRKLKPRKTVVLLNNTCVTTGGQRVTVQVSGAGKIINGRLGKVSLKTARKGAVTVRFSAPATPAFLPFTTTKTYRLK